jgi:hypothetical protein
MCAVNAGGRTLGVTIMKRTSITTLGSKLCVAASTVALPFQEPRVATLHALHMHLAHKVTAFVLTAFQGVSAAHQVFVAKIRSVTSLDIPVTFVSKSDACPRSLRENRATTMLIVTRRPVTKWIKWNAKAVDISAGMRPRPEEFVRLPNVDLQEQVKVAIGTLIAVQVPGASLVLAFH